jgi:hypothetical protein
MMRFLKRAAQPGAALPPGTTVAPSELAAARQTLEDGRAFAPHCDQRILHQPGDCWACDLYPDWQKLRELWGIDFSGHSTPGKLPCPADYHRPPGSLSDHQKWPNNRAERERG